MLQYEIKQAQIQVLCSCHGNQEEVVVMVLRAAVLEMLVNAVGMSGQC